jgi:signal transduction histidine kinase
MADAPNGAAHEHFTVDTGLFRELGELLVGRDSTALVELIKNAYDADASLVTVLAHDLGDRAGGTIIVSDDGNGMTIEEFRLGFLRVASRLKSGGERRSPVYHRRFTGAKGIGRLAAHKLACDLTVESRAVAKPARHTSRRTVSASLRASIDWNEVERHETVEDVGDAISVGPRKIRAADTPGTTIRLSTLRRAWSDRERARFVREVSTFQPGEALRASITPEHVKRALLFDEPLMRDSKSDPGFAVTLGGEFNIGEDYSVDVLAAASWVLEIDASGRAVRYAVAPTRSYAEQEGLDPGPQRARATRPRRGPDFQARIFVRSGRSPQGLGDAYGVRVYMEGFRVLPYGEPGDDWLEVDRRYSVRGRGVPFRGEVEDGRLLDVPDSEAGLVATPLRGIFGAVFLTEARAPGLRMLVNREGFVPDETFLEIADTVANGLALQTRVSAALRPERRKPRLAATERTSEPTPQPTRNVLQSAIEGIRGVAGQSEISPAVRKQLILAEEELTRAQEDVIDEQAMLRVLASLGTQSAAFIHEVNAALGSVASLKRTIDGMLHRRPSARDVAKLQRRVDALQRTLERQSAYLVEIVSRDARRRRSRRRYAEHFDLSALLFQDVAERDGITLRNEIPRDLKTPPMFPAEVTSMFTNLLSNAIKAAGNDGIVQGTGAADDERVRIVVQNTGVAVRLDRAEQWFDPYRSTTATVNPALGQGMGLGLTITRAMLAEYRGKIAFVAPDPGYKTAIEVSLPR